MTDAPDASPTAPAAPAEKGHSLWSDAMRRFRRSRLAVVMTGIIVLYAILALFVQFGMLADDWKEPVGTKYNRPWWARWSIDHRLRLDPASDASPVGDDVTTFDKVTLSGRVESGRAVTIYLYDHPDRPPKQLGEATSDADGRYRFEDIAIEEGDTRFALRINGDEENQLRLKVTRVPPAEYGGHFDLLLGGDFFGQSVTRKMIYGAKISLTVAAIATLISLAIGVPLGAVAGYYGGFVDEIIVWIYSTLSSIPFILLILAFAFVLRDVTVFGYELRGMPAVYLALGLASWVGICRLIRGEVLKHKGRDYVMAAAAYGAAQPRIIFIHILPNVMHLILIDFSLRFVAFVHAEVILSYLGLGPKDEPSWGTMIDEAKQELTREPVVWWQLAAAAGAIFVISVALNIVGDRLRDALDPKLRGVGDDAA